MILWSFQCNLSDFDRILGPSFISAYITAAADDDAVGKILETPLNVVN